MGFMCVWSWFSRYFAGSLGEDKTNCNAVRCLPDDDDDDDGNGVAIEMETGCMMCSGVC